MSHEHARFLVTGCAGFIGSHLTEQLLAQGHSVVGYDNFSTGQRPFLDQALASARFRLVAGDLLNLASLSDAMRGCECVIHLAANADVRHGPSHTRRDLVQNTLATHNVLEAMRTCGVQRIAFASTGAVYGEAAVFPTPENAPFPVQTSLYAASKLACEGLISAYCEAFDFQAWIFRCVSILGERYSHGHVYDFCRQLREHPGNLHVLGDGRQKKSYLHVGDCVTGMLLALERARERVNILNLGGSAWCELSESIAWICAALELDPTIVYSGGERGWVGDSPWIFLDTTRARSLGWEPRLSIQEGVLRTVSYLQENEWLLTARDTAPQRRGSRPHSLQRTWAVEGADGGGA
jgi:UDP-glucose 4-epimerase